MTNTPDWTSPKLAVTSPRSRKAINILIVTVACFAAVALVATVGVIAYFRVQNKPFYIASQSMMPTLQLNDRVVTHHVGSKTNIQRGWIVVYTPNAEEQKATPQLKDIVKRVVGLPGETIEARDGLVYINDQLLREPYLDPGEVTVDIPRQVIPANQYFVLGDNRGNSSDSRVYGPVPHADIKWHAVRVVWPISNARKLD